MRLSPSLLVLVASLVMSVVTAPVAATEPVDPLVRPPSRGFVSRTLAQDWEEALISISVPTREDPLKGDHEVDDGERLHVLVGLTSTRVGNHVRVHQMVERATVNVMLLHSLRGGEGIGRSSGAADVGVALHVVVVARHLSDREYHRL